MTVKHVHTNTVLHITTAEVVAIQLRTIQNWRWRLYNIVCRKASKQVFYVHAHVTRPQYHWSLITRQPSIKYLYILIKKII